MSTSIKSALAVAVVCSIASTNPGLAQMSSSIDDEVGGSQRSKIVDIDIITNSPTLQEQTSVLQPQLPVSGDSFFAPVNSQSNAGSIGSPFQMVQQGGISADPNQFPVQNSAQYSGGASTTASAVTQNAPQTPIQIDSQTVGRVVGVAGTALILGAFLKNGGVGGMINTFGLDNRFHSRGSSLAPY